MDFLLLFVGCVAGLLFVLAAYSFSNDLSARRLPTKSEPRRQLTAAGELGTLPSFESTVGVTDPQTALTRQQQLRLWIDQSGVAVSPAGLIGATFAVGVVPAVAVGVFLNGWLAILVYVLTAALPIAFVGMRRRRRSNRLREQLPDALDLMSRMLRAGQTIPQSFRGVADEFEAPIAEEFGYCYEQQNLGLSTDVSMYEMARRTGVLELRILVVALTVHGRTGGNLSELLDNLADVVRDRYRIYGQIRALTADGRMQAAILLALPPFLLAVLSVLNHDYVTILFQFPWLLVGMFGFELLGALWLRRIVSFDF